MSFVFPVVLEKLNDALSELKGLLPDDALAINELLDYLVEFRQSYDGVEIDNRHPFNAAMLALIERLRSALPDEVHLALQSVHDAID
jgi:hypothetical protein